MRPITLSAGALCVGVLLAAAPASAADTVKWDLSTEYAPTSLPGRADAYFAERVKELSDGQMDITVHYSGALGFKAADHYTAVEDGALQLADTPFNRMNGIYPIFEMQALPFLQSTLDEAQTLDELMRPFYNAKMEQNDQFILFTAPWTPQGFWAKEDVASVEDLKNLRVRVVDLASVQTLKRAGADAIQLSWADTLPALSTGSINAVLTSDDGGLSAKFPEAGLTSFSAVGFTVGVDMVHVNADAFADLPEDLQLVVLTAAAEAGDYGWSIAKETVAGNFAKMGDLGVSVVETVSPEFKAALREASQPAIDDWKERFGPQADMLLDLYQKKVAGE
ncbi:TRAP transporter substrate-binding protein [Acuticoccus mangrovi]|uniref:TRAP transporter substrate-binding protein n=1 Tax=Acuticoccus mangrovi TaxID=2796142 RepID=A0A934IUP5_9HYPH|nr:TRAP transporter substrate-binding protein [Acuticoccus mangrovi]MBJ3778074.1 TRAP transporter substrate-binding protein [Acuticoccus mangrovi]